MPRWIDYLRAGLSRRLPEDKLSNEKKKSDPRANLRALRPYFIRHWQKGVVGAGLILFVTLLTFPQPLIYRFLIDNVLTARRLDLLPLAILLYAGVKLLSMGAGTVQGYYFTRFQQEVMRDLQENLLDHALSLPKSFFDDKAVGYLVSRLSSDVWGLSWFFSSNVVNIISSIFRFIGGIIFLFYLNWQLAIGTLIVLPLLIVGTRYFSERMHILSHHGMEQNANISKRFQETLSSLPLIKAFASEKRESGRIMSAVADIQQLQMEQTMVSSMANLVLGSLPSLAGGMVFVIGAYWIIRGEWTLGTLLAFQSYLGYVYGPAMSLSNANLELQNAMTALERVSAIFNINSEEKDGTGLKVAHLRGDIRFEDVSFSYNCQEMVLEDISFSIKPGEHVVIAGPSGVGKTTLISLLLQFYRPTNGKICLDDQDAVQFELRSLRERIGYVSQSTLLLAGTIRENLCYGNPEATQAQIDRATGIAGITEFIEGLPNHYETIIDERGVNLSDGQKQRLSIARALIKDPDILILDEPTSAVDALAEQSIFDALPDVVRNKTLIVVTHRLSTIQKADRIMVLNDASQVATGSHAELMGSNSYYQSLFAGR